MAYTIRTDEQQEKVIAEAAKVLGTLTATKTMILACEKIPVLTKDLENANEVISKLSEKIKNITGYLESKIQAENKILNFVRNNK
jgi:predicted ribosome quality control (RQC) complex YloA/Tae2 family protein